MQRCATADDHHAVEVGQIARRSPHAREHRSTEVEIKPPADRIAQGVRLLVDLLQHEMLITTLLRRRGIHAKLGNLARDRHIVEIADIDGLRRDNRDVVVVEIYHPLRVSNDRRSIGRNDRFAIAHTDHDRAATPRGDDATRLARREHGDAKSSFDLMQGIANRLEKIALVAIADQMREHLGVGFREEMMTLALKPRAQRAVVFNDAIVHQCDVAALVEVRVCIDLGRRPMGCPTGVRDAGAGAGKPFRRPVGACAILQCRHLARSLRHRDAITIHHREACRIVATIFKPTQTIDEHLGRLRFANVSDDSAHDF